MPVGLNAGTTQGKTASGFNLVDQSELLRLLRRDEVTGEQHLHRLFAGHIAAQGYCRRRTEKTDIYSGNREAGILD